MRRPSFAAVFVLLSTALLGCAPAEEDDEDETAVEDEIRKGRVESGQPAVGLLLYANGAMCSGTLIAPDLVLTAGHCVDKGSVPSAFYTGDGRAAKRASDAVAGMQRHPVRAAKPAPGYEETGKCPNTSVDIGLVKLARRVEGIAPAKINARTPRLLEKCTAVGFGRHPSSKTIGQKRSATVSYRWPRGTAFVFGDVTGGTESGDSGGPLLCGGAIVAVNSCGSSPDRFARVDKAISWIDARRKSWD